MSLDCMGIGAFAARCGDELPRRVGAIASIGWGGLLPALPRGRQARLGMGKPIPYGVRMDTENL